MHRSPITGHLITLSCSPDLFRSRCKLIKMAYSRKTITVTASSLLHLTTSALPDFSWPSCASVTISTPASSTPSLQTFLSKQEDPPDWIGRSVVMVLRVITLVCVMWLLVGCWRGDCRRWQEPEDCTTIQLPVWFLPRLTWMEKSRRLLT
jgi:hypothetical protein